MNEIDPETKKWVLEQIEAIKAKAVKDSCVPEDMAEQIQWLESTLDRTLDAMEKMVASVSRLPREWRKFVANEYKIRVGETGPWAIRMDKHWLESPPDLGYFIDGKPPA